MPGEIQRCAVKLPARDLPEEVGGILFKDGSVEVQCTPLDAVAGVERGVVNGTFGQSDAPPPVEVAVFGVVDAVLHYDDGGDEERHAKLVVRLRSSLAPGDACEVEFRGGAALVCVGLLVPAAAVAIARGVARWARGAGYVFCGARAVVAAARDATLAAVGAAFLRRRRPDFCAAVALRVAGGALAALRRVREKGGAWAAADEAREDLRGARCWRCGDGWSGAACASAPLCGGRRPPGGAARPVRGSRAVAVELEPGLRTARLRCPPRPRGEPRDDPRQLEACAARLGEALGLAPPTGAGAWPTLPLRDLGGVARGLRDLEAAGKIRGYRLPPPSVIELARSPLPDRDVAAELARIPGPLAARLAPFQREGVELALRRRRLLIGDEMGAGKTLQALAAAAAVREKHWPLLIVCPAGLRAYWASEIDGWLPFLRPSDVRVVASSLDAPAPPPAPTPRVVIVSFAMLERLRELDADGPFFFPSVIVDEAHVLASATARLLPADAGESKQTRRAVGLVKRATGLALLLSGTPAMGRPLALFPALDALARGGAAGDERPLLRERSFGDRKLAFCRAWCGAKRWRGGPKGQACYDGVAFHAELHAVLATRYMVRRLKKDVLAQLPPLARSVVRLPGGDAAAARGGGGGDDAEDAEGAPAAAAERATTMFRAAGLAKAGAAAAFVVDRLGRDGAARLVVFAHHVDVLDALYAAIEAARSDPGSDPGSDGGRWAGPPPGRLDGSVSCRGRDAALRAFNAGGRCLLVSVTAGGVGIDLTASSEAVFVEAVGLPAAWLRQAEDRLHRRGQERRVRITYLLQAPGSWEDVQWPRVHARLACASAVFNGEADAEAFDVDDDGSDAGTRRRATASRAPPRDSGAADGGGDSEDLAPWRWLADAASDDDDDDDDDDKGGGGDGAEGVGLYFEASPHSARLHLHRARDGSAHAGESVSLSDLALARRRAASGSRAAVDAARAALPPSLAGSPEDARAAWRFGVEWARLTTRQRSSLYGRAVRPPLALAAARAHVADARAAPASTRRYTPAEESMQRGRPRAGCEPSLVRLGHRERRGLAPLVQYTVPAAGLAKCLCCPAFYRCAPRRADGAYDGSLQELFCSPACRTAYAATTSGAGLRRVVFARDGGVCAACRSDGHALVEKLRAAAAVGYGRRYALALRHAPAWADHAKALGRLLANPRDGLAWEADHGTRVADGGGEATADAVQTLCVPCHRAKTKAEHKAAAAKRREAKAPAGKRRRAAPPEGPDAAAVLAALADDGDDDWM